MPSTTPAWWLRNISVPSPRSPPLLSLLNLSKLTEIGRKVSRTSFLWEFGIAQAHRLRAGTAEATNSDWVFLAKRRSPSSLFTASATTELLGVVIKPSQCICARIPSVDRLKNRRFLEVHQSQGLVPLAVTILLRTQGHPREGLGDPFPGMPIPRVWAVPGTGGGRPWVVSKFPVSVSLQTDRRHCRD